MSAGKFIIAALLLGPPCLQAHVTSALLEFSCDDKAELWLNGKKLLDRSDPRSDFHAFDYTALSTSDGTLPLELFNPNGDNLLAVHNLDTEGQGMAVSYRLTVHHSNGDPVVVWGEPGNTKFLHVVTQRGEPVPAGWSDLGFDDSLWKPAVEAFSRDDFAVWPELPDAAFAGSGGVVPHLSHRSDARVNAAGDQNLFRSHFRFPNTPAKAAIFVNPPTALAGQKLALRLLPGADAADFGPFHMAAVLPRGLEPLSPVAGAHYDPAARRLSWSFSKYRLGQGFQKLGAASVIEASGWSAPEKILGPEKPHARRRQLNMPDIEYNEGAHFMPGSPAWFKMQAPVPPAGAASLDVLGVVFRLQLKGGANDTARGVDFDPVMLNYSVDGSLKPFLFKDVPASRTSVSWYWTEGYYDASEDRKWTWEDLKQLRVRIGSQLKGRPNKTLLASCVATVRYVQPTNTAPVFYAQVTERRCATLPIQVSVSNAVNKLAASDPFHYPVNLPLCPKPTPLPQPAARPGLPTPTPLVPREGPGMALVPEAAPLKLGCLQSGPEPFARGGVYIYFCLNQDAEVSLKISDSSGRMLREMPAGAFRAGDNQLFFNGLDKDGKPLRPGKYSAEIQARNRSRAGSMHMSINRAPGK